MLADAGHDGVITSVGLLRTHANCAMAASISLMHHNFVMMGRAGTAVTVSHDLYEGLLAAADRLSASPYSYPLVELCRGGIITSYVDSVARTCATWAGRNITPVLCVDAHVCSCISIVFVDWLCGTRLA